VGEVNPELRRPLEEALDVFEMAMSSGDRETYQAAREGLLMVLAQLGVTYDGDHEPPQSED
jgi:hypothetical protein